MSSSSADQVQKSEVALEKSERVQDLDSVKRNALLRGEDRARQWGIERK